MAKLSQPQVQALKALGEGPLLRPANAAFWNSPSKNYDEFQDTTLKTLQEYGLLLYRGDGRTMARITDRGALVLSLVKAGEPYRLTRKRKKAR